MSIIGSYLVVHLRWQTRRSTIRESWLVLVVGKQVWTHVELKEAWTHMGLKQIWIYLGLNKVWTFLGLRPTVVSTSWLQHLNQTANNLTGVSLGDPIAQHVYRMITFNQTAEFYLTIKILHIKTLMKKGNIIVSLSYF